MAFQTGTANSPIDLVQKMGNWLVSIGWNLDMSQADGIGWRVHVDKGGIYVHLYGAMNQQVWAQGGDYAFAVFMYMSSAFDGSQPWNAQPGNPPKGNGQSYTVGVGMALETGGAIQNYYFFSDALDNVALIVERTAGLYVTLGFGASLTKVGMWTGGQYFFVSTIGPLTGQWQGQNYTPHPSPGYFDSASCPGTVDYNNCQDFFVRCDVDSFTGQWIGVSSNTYPPYGYTGKFAQCSVAPVQSFNPEYNIAGYTSNGGPPPPWGSNTFDFEYDQTSSADNRANLIPPLIWAQRDFGEWSLIGSIPNIFSTNGVGNGFSNASEYVIGTTHYMMFPNFAVIKQ